MATALELFAQARKVLDDAVVYHGDVVGAGRMRMRVALARLAVRSPTRVAYAAGAHDIHGVDHVRKGGNLAHLMLHIDASGGLHGDARRIVTAIFHALKSAQQDVFDLERSGISDDSAHIRTLPTSAGGARSHGRPRQRTTRSEPGDCSAAM